MSDKNIRKCDRCGEQWPVGFLGKLARSFDLSGCPACNGEEWKATVPGGKSAEPGEPRPARAEPLAHH
jgi:predicted  nucleic acid-binding Zn-ribbon protein